LLTEFLPFNPVFATTFALLSVADATQGRLGGLIACLGLPLDPASPDLAPRALLGQRASLGGMPALHRFALGSRLEGPKRQGDPSVTARAGANAQLPALIAMLGKESAPLLLVSLAQILSLTHSLRSVLGLFHGITGSQCLARLGSLGTA
jgi:hypothetical protein